MDKQKQIEEMAKVLSTVKRCDALAVSECIKKKCEYPHYSGVPCIAEHQAEALYNAGYRKIPENAVVLTNDEFWKLSNKFSKKELDEIVEFHKNKARKETVEKVAERLKALFPIKEDIFSFTTSENIHKAVDEVCKEIIGERKDEETN